MAFVADLTWIVSLVGLVIYGLWMVKQTLSS